MENFFSFLETHINGFLILILLVFAIVAVINWLARIFKWGKYKGVQLPPEEYSNTRYIISQFFVNIISDFKHLLALVIVIIFASLIIYSMRTTDDFEEKMKALQLVIASLGGLLGSIIGYYFGESAARTGGQSISVENELTQQGGSGDDSITPAPEVPNNI